MQTVDHFFIKLWVLKLYI